MKNCIKNAFFYAYYEIYLQEHSFYKRHKDKNFYAITTFCFLIGFLFYFPITLLYHKIIGIAKFFYVLIVIITYAEIYFLSNIIGNNDLTDNINAFYEKKKTVKNSRKVVWVFVLICLLLWIVAIKYDPY